MAILVTGGSKGIGLAIARAIAYAVEQPDDVDVNEVIVRPTSSPL